MHRVVRSPGFAADEVAVAERTGRAYAPTLVIHGADDLMCDVSGGLII